MRRVGTFLALLLCAVFGTTTTLAAPFHFASLGDWGCVPIGGWHKRDELTVARQFSNATAEIRARFILNTGDNFYRCGVHSKTDDVWNTTFEHVFTHESTKVPWWGCLGNHDYGFPGSAEAELAYRSPNKDRWNLPGRYYYRRLSFPGEVNISLVVLDSPPCQKEYRSSDPKHWDPCGSGKKPCPGCAFHQNVIEQNCTKQYEWLKSVMPTIPRDDWKIMLTHAPATSLNVEDLVGEFQKYDFDLYMNGHVHLLGHYQLDGKGTYITTGAACMVKIREGDRDDEEDDDEKKNKASRSACSGKSPWHKCESVFEQTVAGYSTHSFNADFTELSTHLFDYTGKLLHTAVSKKSKSKVELPEDQE